MKYIFVNKFIFGVWKKEKKGPPENKIRNINIGLKMKIRSYAGACWCGLDYYFFLTYSQEFQAVVNQKF